MSRHRIGIDGMSLRCVVPYGVEVWHSHIARVAEPPLLRLLGVSWCGSYLRGSEGNSFDIGDSRMVERLTNSLL